MKGVTGEFCPDCEKRGFHTTDLEVAIVGIEWTYDYDDESTISENSMDPNDGEPPICYWWDKVFGSQIKPKTSRKRCANCTFLSIVPRITIATMMVNATNYTILCPILAYVIFTLKNHKISRIEGKYGKGWGRLFKGVEITPIKQEHFVSESQKMHGTSFFKQVLAQCLEILKKINRYTLPR